MNVLILNGSPHPDGNTAAMIRAFCEGASEAGYPVQVIDVGSLKVSACSGCEFCHNVREGICVKKDDMEKVYQALRDAHVLILASPVHFYSLSGPLQTVLGRTYALGRPKRLKKCGMLLSARSGDSFDAAFLIHRKMLRAMGVEDAGILTSDGLQNPVPERREALVVREAVSSRSGAPEAEIMLEKAREFGRRIGFSRPSPTFRA